MQCLIRMPEYKPPSIEQRAFCCPHCYTLARQYWFRLHLGSLRASETPKDLINSEFGGNPGLVNLNSSHSSTVGLAGVYISSCEHCADFAIWLGGKMVCPDTGVAPPPNEDLSDEVREIYREAVAISSKSPRGSAALIRLAVQKLCTELGEEQHTLNEAIAQLVRKGLNPKVQKMLDYVRVTGNDAVHPGQMDFNDNAEIVGTLFVLLNLIAESMITHPKVVDEAYESLPVSKKEQIKKRDGN